VVERRWLADEMVGRLARYLRFLGYDTEYVRGLDDAMILERARTEERILLTRDRALAVRLPGSVYLSSPLIREQLAALRGQYPDLRLDVRFDRCSLCNGDLEEGKPGSAGPVPAEPSTEHVPAGGVVFVCRRCGHRYWDGSHTADVRRRLREWFPTGTT
jgi:uncharacterized protein with PIN domain